MYEFSDLFRQIFPDSDPYGGNRFRYNPAFDLIGQTLSDFASQYSREEGLSNYTLKGVQSSYFDYHTDTNAEGEPFKSWKEKGGSYDVNGSASLQSKEQNLVANHCRQLQCHLPMEFD
jgi:hypothetical protein